MVAVRGKTMGYLVSEVGTEEVRKVDCNYCVSIVVAVFLLLVTRTGATNPVPPKGDVLTRCSSPTSDEPLIHYDEYRWYYTLDEMETKFTELYHSGKRLADRARWNAKEKRFELIHRSFDVEKIVPITYEFIDSVRNHVEHGLELGYFSYVFFPDMGHAHLLIPVVDDENSIIRLPADRQHEVYEWVLSNPDSRFLYHTAEQLKMLDDSNEVLSDRRIGWRFFTRNLIANNNSSGHLAIYNNLDSIGNTVCTAPDNYYLWSAGFYISASKDGCFSYTHDNKTYHFDISLTDFPRVKFHSPFAQRDRMRWGADQCY